MVVCLKRLTHVAILYSAFIENLVFKLSYSLNSEKWTEDSIPNVGERKGHYHH